MNKTPKNWHEASGQQAVDQPAPKTRAKAKPVRIAQLGTFDVENYGDLLFPLLAERRLREGLHDLNLEAVSPAGSSPVWSDSPTSLGWEAFSQNRSSYSGFLVGGGNIIRANISELEAYSRGTIPLLGYANLWAGVAAGNTRSSPICWNAPGVPAPLPKSLRALFRACLERTDYVSVRDEQSCDLLKEVAPNLNIVVAPDSAWEIDKIWTAEQLAKAYQNAFAARGMSSAERTVVIHVNSRYLGGANIGQIGSLLDGLCQRLDAKGILIAIGPCHGDDELARNVARCMKTSPLVIDRPLSLVEVAACIANSVAYLGSSMHGFITASAFRVPGVIVASPKMIKFAGLMSEAGLPSLLNEQWPDAIRQLTDFNRDQHVSLLGEVHSAQIRKLDSHWNTIAEVFQSRDASKILKQSLLKYEETILSVRAIEYFRANRDFQGKNVNLTKELSATSDALILANAETERQNAELDGLRSQLKMSDEQISALNRNLSDLAERLTAAQADASSGQREVEAEREEVRRVSRQNTVLSYQLRELETQLVGLRREKHELLTSTSWRITAPVRAMPARIRAPARLLAKLAWWTITPRLWATRYKYYRNVLAIKRTEGVTTPSVAQRSPGPATEQVEARYIRERIEAQFNSVAIIVPVYNAPQETDECIRSVLRHSDPSVRLIVINDASPNPEIREVLAQYTDLPNVEVVHNETNLGFTRTINRGIELAGSADVVFLNSDTIVTPQWLRNLQFAAYSEDRIATATPFSDNAGAFSAPEIGKKNPIPTWLELDDYARLVTRNSKRHYPKVPTGNGFCMFVRRACIDEVGTLDAETFPRGYGEENDFCMRAGRKGWQHVIDDATLIHHVRSASFGDEKTQLMKDGRAVVDKRYPEYSNRVRSFIDDPIASAARQRVGEAASVLLQQNGVRPRAVFVVSTRTGGTPQTNQDLMEALHDRYEAYLLRCDAKTVEFFQIAGREQILLETVKLEQPLKAFPHASEEYDAIVRQLLIQHQIELVHIRHIAWHSLKLPAICKSLQVPVVFSFHDFYTICPTVKLLDENLQFCGGTCTASLGQCKHELWTDPDFPPLKRNAIKDWQSAMSEMLAHCDSYVTTSHGSRDQITQIYPAMQKKPFVVIPHGRDLEIKNVTTTARSIKEKIRILVPGNIDISKGAGILESLAELDKDGIFEFHLLGRTTIPLTKNFVFHGPYKREEFIQKVEKIRPHFGAIFSIWPETFCHTLTEMWACGLPVLALDFGAVAERIRQTGGGWLLENSSPQILFERLQAITQDFEDYSQKVDQVRLWQDEIGRTNSTLWMSQYYDEIYRNLLTREIHLSEGLHRPRVGVVLPGNGPSYPASSHIRVLEKIRDNIRRPVRYDLVQPGDVANESVVGQFNAILVQRTALQPNDLAKFTSACSSSGTKVIFEIDDDLIGMGDRRDLTVNYEAFKQSVKSIAQTADVVIASTPILADRLRTINSSVAIAENALSERLWFGPIASGSDDLGVPSLQKRASQEIRIVYMGTKTHSADLALLEQPIRVLRSEFPNLRFFTIGITDISENWFENVNIKDKYKAYSNFVPWFRNFAAEMDIAVAPLDDTSFNAAKSPLKFYEYSAAKLCGLYSAVEPYKSAVRSGVTGYLVDNNVEAWTDSLRHAIERPDEKRQIVARAFDEMLHHHGMKAAAEQLDNIVKDLSAVQPEVKIVGGGVD